MYPKVYDLNLNLVAILENAFNIGYEKRLNELWTAHFSLPANDPKNAECLPLRFVEIFDGDERVELFRILPSKFGKSGDGLTMTYQCEHVLSTLLDDILFQYHQTSNLSPANTLAYILSKQTTQRWAVGTVNLTINDESYENIKVRPGLTLEVGNLVWVEIPNSNLRYMFVDMKL
jgi:phage minor structural protein